jgi:TetR/AcrR family transcriptional repressor of nem operon
MADKSAHKERTRARILDEAAQALRVGGTEGVSVGALMKRAGLTHGGFYAHFDSRDDLVAHAVERMFKDSALMLDRALPEGAGVDGVVALIDYYLSERAMAAPERHCPLPSLSGEVGRMPPLARAKFEAGVNTFRARLESALLESARDSAAQLATAILSEMVGAMALARVMTDPAAANSILQSSRDNLKRRLRSEAGT